MASTKQQSEPPGAWPLDSQDPALVTTEVDRWRDLTGDEDDPMMDVSTMLVEPSTLKTQDMLPEDVAVADASVKREHSLLRAIDTLQRKAEKAEMDHQADFDRLTQQLHQTPEVDKTMTPQEEQLQDGVFRERLILARDITAVRGREHQCALLEKKNAAIAAERAVEDSTREERISALETLLEQAAQIPSSPAALKDSLEQQYNARRLQQLKGDEAHNEQIRLVLQGISSHAGWTAYQQQEREVAARKEKLQIAADNTAASSSSASKAADTLPTQDILRRAAHEGAMMVSQRLMHDVAAYVLMFDGRLSEEEEDK
ncbi:hypothetical protein NX059_002546 [Plenodomus lindquistii]|nr:hypothetical protein NX059_002546 [Plenodomus lindquistii]